MRSRTFVARVIALAALGVTAAMPADGSALATDFSTWLDGFKKEAASRGIGDETLAAAFVDVSPLPAVIEQDRKQPEFTLTFEQYMARVVSPKRIRRGRTLMAENRALLEDVARRYNVQPRFIVALWGIESDYGRLTGGYPVIAALATLAYDGRRAEFFRRELLSALQILEEGHITPALMTGSWAGAMGQSQFMPSSFVRFAVDFDGNGRRDIWTSKPDVFGSAANYLGQSGWRDDQTWGRRVRLPKNFDSSQASLDIVRSMREWEAMGVRRADGSPLPSRNLPGSIVLPAGPGGPAYLVYKNFRVILRWNRSTYFAVAVGRLSDAIGNR